MAALHVGGLKLSRHLEAADWISGDVCAFDYSVGSLLTPHFPSYARIFHPAYLKTDAGGDSEVRWSTVAVANNRQPHPAMEWVSITGSWRFLHGDHQPGIWDDEPMTGSLPLRQTLPLVELLADHTTTPEECWYSVWEGYGVLPLPRAWPMVERPHRRMLLLTGSLTAATTSLEPHPNDQRANLWWPQDRAWCVATEVDLMSTYIGGTEACIEDVIVHRDLEALPVAHDQRITWDTDKVNGAPLRQS